MSRIIRPDARLVQEFTYHQEKLPIDKPVVQYIRQSSLGQVKHNVQSKVQQDEMLRRHLLAYGWKDADIIKIEADQGKSGQKLRIERSGLDYLYKLIKSGQAGAIACYDASRLWRDTTHVWYNDLISYWLIPYNIPVVMHNRVYWPNNQQDMDALREDFRQAAYQLRHIYEKVNPARLVAVEMSQSYGGHCVPMGFVIAEEDNRKFFAVYEDHARLIRWLFKRYRELGGNLARLRHELQTMGFTFPAFSGIEKIPHVGLPFDGNGYPLKTRGALVSILTNVAYIGMYVFNGVVVSRDGASIVPLDDFMYAYSRLSETTLDGQVNENKPQVDRRFGVACPALLEGILQSNGNPAYVMASDKTYDVRNYQDGWEASELVVPVATLDHAFTDAMLKVLEAIEQRKRDGLQDELQAQLTALQAEKQEEVVSLDDQLVTIDRAIRGWELDKQSCRETGNIHGLNDANIQLKRLYADRASLEVKTQHADTEAEQLVECVSLHSQAVHDWHSMKFDQKKRYVRLLVKTANLTQVSPHVLQLEITLRSPLHATLVGYLYRARGDRPNWTPEETDTLKRMYPHADRLSILKAVPTRGWEAIQKQARAMGLKRSILRSLNTSGIDDTMSYSDRVLLDQLGGKLQDYLWFVADYNSLDMALFQSFDTLTTYPKLLGTSGTGPPGIAVPGPEWLA